MLLQTINLIATAQHEIVFFPALARYTGQWRNNRMHGKQGPKSDRVDGRRLCDASHPPLDAFILGQVGETFCWQIFFAVLCASILGVFVCLSLIFVKKSGQWFGQACMSGNQTLVAFVTLSLEGALSPGQMGSELISGLERGKLKWFSSSNLRVQA